MKKYVWILGLILSSCTMVKDGLTSGEADALAERARLYAGAQVEAGFIVGKKVKISLADGEALLDRSEQRPVVNNKTGTVVPMGDADMLRSTPPSVRKVLWRNPEKRIGTAVFQWLAPSGLVYKFEFDGPLAEPEKCQFRLTMPPQFELEGAQVYEKNIPPANGPIRFEGL